MNLDNFINTAENDCANIIKVILKKPEIKKFLNYQGFKLHEAYYKTLIPIFFSSKVINFYIKIKNKEIKNKETIKVYSLEEKLLINELKNKFKLNKFVFVDFKDTFYQLKKFLFYVICLIIKNFFSDQKNRYLYNHKMQILSFVNNEAEKNNYLSFFKKIKIKKKYFNLNKKFLFNKRKIFKINFDFKNNFTNTNFLSIYKLYIKFFIIKNIINFYKPKIICFFEGDNDINGIINTVAKKYKITSICLQWGAFMTPPYPKAGFRMLSSNYLFVWGKYYKYQFQKYNKKIKIIIVGNPALKTRKSLINSKNISIFCAKESYNLKEKDRFDLCELALWIKNNIKNYQVIIRKHPYDKSKKYINNFYSKIITHDPLKIKIQDTINSSELMITNISGSAIEAARSGTIPLLLNSSKITFEKNIEKIRKFKNIKLIGSLSEIKETITILTKNHRVRKYVRNKIMNNLDNNIKYLDFRAQNIVKKQISKILSSSTLRNCIK